MTCDIKSVLFLYSIGVFGLAVGSYMFLLSVSNHQCGTGTFFHNGQCILFGVAEVAVIVIFALSIFCFLINNLVNYGVTFGKKK